MYEDRKVAFRPPVVVYTHTEMGIRKAACRHQVGFPYVFDIHYRSGHDDCQESSLCGVLRAEKKLKTQKEYLVSFAFGLWSTLPPHKEDCFTFKRMSHSSRQHSSLSHTSLFAVKANIQASCWALHGPVECKHCTQYSLIVSTNGVSDIHHITVFVPATCLCINDVSCMSPADCICTT